MDADKMSVDGLMALVRSYGAACYSAGIQELERCGNSHLPAIRAYADACVTKAALTFPLYTAKAMAARVAAAHAEALEEAAKLCDDISKVSPELGPGAVDCADGIRTLAWERNPARPHEC